MDLNKSYTPEEEKDLAQTPLDFFLALERYLNIQFDLDACAIQATAKANNYYSLLEKNQNSLELPWCRTNFVNPPYSDIMPWCKKAYDEAKKGNTSALLIPDKPEVKYMQYCHLHADTIFHMPYRLNFLRPNGEPFMTKEGKKQGPKFPVCVVLFTPHVINPYAPMYAYHKYMHGIREEIRRFNKEIDSIGAF